MVTNLPWKIRYLHCPFPPTSHPLFLQCGDHFVGAAALAGVLIVAHALFVVAALARQREIAWICRITTIAQRLDVLERGLRHPALGDEELGPAVNALADPIRVRVAEFTWVNQVKSAVSHDHAQDHLSSTLPLRPRPLLLRVLRLRGLVLLRLLPTHHLSLHRRRPVLHWRPTPC